jgi:hypothetical protein
LTSIPTDGLVDEISTILESFDTFNLAFHAMNEFPNSRDRVEWIERYRRQVVGLRRQDEEYHLFFTDGIASLRTIRTSLHAQATPLG